MRKTILRGVERKGSTYYLNRPFPLIGHLYFGLIDRGLNIVQARITSLCNLSCRFCSVDAGQSSRRIAEFMVWDPEWFSEWVDLIVSYKEDEVDVLFDAAGDPVTNPLLPEFIRSTKRNRKVRWVILETRLHGATRQLIDELAEAGLDRINVSIDTLDAQKAAYLSGNPSYNIENVVKLVEYAFHQHGIDVHVAPVWIPGVNDHDLEEIVEWAIRNGFGRRIPPLGIQKYVVHPHGRKIQNIDEPSWEEWERFLRRLEDKYGVKLVLSMSDYGLRKSRQFKPPLRRGDETWVIAVGEGPYQHEFLGVTKDYKWALTLLSKKEVIEEGDMVLARIIRNKDGILIAVPT